jgi:hypothetical protein
MACKHLEKEYGSCNKPGVEQVCGQWCKWDWEERTAQDEPDTFCKNEQYSDRWEQLANEIKS